MPRALFVCAIPVEWDAIHARLENHTDVFEEGDFYLRAKLRREIVTWDVVVAQVGTGNVGSALESMEAIKRFKPDIALFVGVAGGRKDAAKGDVVVATQVHYYESGKDLAAGTLSRPRSSDQPYLTQQIAKALSRSPIATDTFKVFGAPIAAGEKVVGSATSHTGELIAANYGDSLAVEMEGAGFTAALKRFDVDHALIRGVSDLLDGKTDADASGWQERAAANAMEVACRFLDRYMETKAGGDTPRSATPAGPNVGAASTPAANLQQSIPFPNATQNYVLIATKGSALSEVLLSSALPVTLVIDVDPDTDRSGVLSLVRPLLSRSRNIKLLTLDDESQYSVGSCTWLAMRGLVGRGVPISTTRDWLVSGKRLYQSNLDAYAQAIGGRNTTVLVAVDGDDSNPWVRLAVEDLIATLADHVSVILLGAGEGHIHQEFADSSLHQTPDELRAGLLSWLGDVEQAGARRLPGLSEDVSVEPADAAWLSEDLMPLWLDIEGDPDLETLDFLRGGTIGWAALAADADVQRTAQFDLSHQLRAQLENRRATRINLFHEPGAGGTTVGRRAIHELHRQYPSVEVRALRRGETARRIDWVARASGHPVVALVDSAELSDRYVDDLLAELRASSVPAVVLHVSRRFNRPSELSNSHYIGQRLDDLEASDFYQRYATEAPDVDPELRELRDSQDDRRTPFFFALTAFETDFQGLDSYVAQRLTDLAPDQERIVLFCALAHYYGQQGVPEYQLASLVGLPPAKAGTFRSLLHPRVRSLLWRSEAGAWRTVHQLVAQEILQQLGGRSEWRQRLSDWGRLFAEFCASNSDNPPEELIELVRTVFVYRGGDELLGTEISGRDMFSRFVEDIPSNEGAVDLLAYVSSLFPNEAHLAAHVARFYAFRLRNYARAVDFSQRALEAAPRSAILRHVAGMVHRAEAYEAIGSRAPVDEVAEFGRVASKHFAAARELSFSQNEHAYISDAQLRIRVVDYATRNAGSVAEYLKAAGAHPYVIECLGEAESLLSQVRDSRDLREPSGYEARSRSDLARLYGNYNDALQMLDALLARVASDKAPIRRQLVWTYLARSERDWTKVGDKALRRMVSLLQENLTEHGSSPGDIRLWWRAVRFLNPPPSQDRVLELLAYWRESQRSREAVYCSYVAYALEMLDGLSAASPQMIRYRDECSAMSTGVANRTWSFEWIGDGQGMSKLVHQSELGEWDQDSGFWSRRSRLRRLDGRVSKISGPQAGTVEVAGMTAFFVPARAGLERGRDENALVSGYLGFSYDGPRLWDVVPDQEK